MSALDDVFDDLEPAPVLPSRPRKSTTPPEGDEARSGERKSASMDASEALPASVSLNDFYAYMPDHQYLHVPTRTLWPASSVNGRIPPVPIVGARTATMAPAKWLDQNRAIEQLTWQPGEPSLIRDRVILVSGWSAHPGSQVFNRYKAPDRVSGRAELAGPWIDHLRRVYPSEAARIELWLAHRIQRPGEKINHALVLGGTQGIGKDTILEPIKAGVGPWNCQEVSPAQMLGRFNGWAQAVILRVSEARDLGDTDRIAFYDHSKTYIAAPPDVIRVDEKNLREHYVANVCGVIITTNHKTNGLYLPADDRRHFVAWSEVEPGAFGADYWNDLYRWYAAGGTGHVIAHLMALDLSGFDPKAPPPKTPAFWAIVHSGEAPESGELRDVLDRLELPAAVTLEDLIRTATELQLHDLASDLRDRKARRTWPHKLERVGYVPVRNPDAKDGLFKIKGRRQAVYARRELELVAQVRAAQRVS